MLPNSAVKTENLLEALDGDQPMQFHYVRCMSYLSNLSWESSPWCRLGILAPFRLRQVQEVRLRSKTCATSTIRVGTLTLRQEREMGAGCGTPIRGPWAGLATCEPPPGGAARADAARADAARADAACTGRALRWPSQGAARADAARADAAVRDGRGSADRARARARVRGGINPSS
jgi:hypothetical protein